MTDHEKEFINPQFRKRNLNPLPPSNRRIFLYEVSQLSQQADHFEAQFRVDLQHFLRLEQPIPPMIWVKPGINHTDEKIIRDTTAKKIDICDDKYEPVRAVLMEQAIGASRWIRQHFVGAPDVFVSSPEHFKDTIMASWETDPCIERNAAKKIA